MFVTNSSVIRIWEILADEEIISYHKSNTSVWLCEQSLSTYDQKVTLSLALAYLQVFEQGPWLPAHGRQLTLTYREQVWEGKKKNFPWKIFIVKYI